MHKRCSEETCSAQKDEQNARHIAECTVVHFLTGNTPSPVSTSERDRVDIWRDRCDRRSCKKFASCVNFSENSAINLVHQNPIEAWIMVLNTFSKCFFTNV